MTPTVANSPSCLCWALDRFSREGMIPTIGYLQRLAAAGVGFHRQRETDRPTITRQKERSRGPR
jgi:hypothetical protein